MPAGVCDTESVYWCSGDFFYCSTCEEEYMSDFFVCSALTVLGDFGGTFHWFCVRGGILWLCDAS